MYFVFNAVIVMKRNLHGDCLQCYKSMTPASGSASVAMSSVKGAGRGKRAGQQVHWQHPEIPGTITSMAATPSTRHHPDNSPHTAPVMKTPWVICGLNLLNIFADLNKQILSSFFC